MASILFVRVKSGLGPKELERRLIERRPRFHEVPGLVQKIYGRDESKRTLIGRRRTQAEACPDAHG